MTRIADLARSSGRDLDDVLDLWSERAGIREHDGGLARDVAEREAFSDVQHMLEGARRGPRSAGSQIAELPRSGGEPVIAETRRADEK